MNRILRVGLAKTQISHQLWLKAWPLIVANISVPMLGFVDTAVMGHLGDPRYLAGAALGALVINVLVWIVGFLRMSMTAQVAQSYGACSFSTRRPAILKAGIITALFLSLGLILFSDVLFNLLVLFMAHDGLEETISVARSYFEIRRWALPLSLINIVAIGFLIGQGNTRFIMKIALWSNVINLIADLVLVVGFSMQVSGLAFAAVLAECCAFTMIIWQLRSHLLRAWRAQIHRSMWRQMLSANGHLLIRALLLQGSLTLLTISAGQHGTNWLAVNAILMQFFLFISFVMDGIAHSLESMVGRLTQPTYKRRLRVTVTRAMQFSFVFALFYSALFAVSYYAIVNMLTNISALKALLNQYYFAIVGLPIIAFASFIFDGVFVGMGWSQQMRNSMLIATMVFVTLWWLIADWGYSFLWLAFNVFIITRWLTQWLYVRRLGLF